MAPSLRHDPLRETMTPEAEADRHRRWVETWRAAVRASPSVVGLVELPSTRFVELSQTAAELLGTTPREGTGLDYLAVVERPRDAAVCIRLVTRGAVEGVHARRRLRRSDGSVIELPTCGRAIRSQEGRDLGLWVAGDEATKHLAPLENVGVERGGTDAPEREERWSAVASLDDHWRVARLDTEVDEVLGYGRAELLGTSLTALVRPDDLAALLLTFARATSDGSAKERISLRHGDGTWRAVAAVVTAVEHGGPPEFSVALTGAATSPVANSGRVNKLERHLRRIATELRAAGVMVTPIDADDFGETRALSGLSARQEEVVARLMRGERVPRIAKAMYLSQSTVRNHLTAIFRKAGVHSQDELLALLHGTPLADLNRPGISGGS